MHVSTPYKVLLLMYGCGVVIAQVDVPSISTEFAVQQNNGAPTTHTTPVDANRYLNFYEDEEILVVVENDPSSGDENDPSSGELASQDMVVTSVSDDYAVQENSVTIVNPDSSTVFERFLSQGYIYFVLIGFIICCLCCGEHCGKDN